MFSVPLLYLSRLKCNWCICLEFIAFFSRAAEGIMGRGEGGYKGYVFIRIGSDRLIRDCYGMYSSGDSCLRHRSQHVHQQRDWFYKLWGISNVIYFHGFGTSVLFMLCDFRGTISIIEIKRLVKV